MLMLPQGVKIFIARQPVSLARSFDGLAALVRDVVQQDPLAGHLFVFRNRRGDRCKILFWHTNGLVIWYKRLEKGTFRFPSGREACVEIETRKFAVLLEGVDVAPPRRRRTISSGARRF